MEIGWYLRLSRKRVIEVLVAEDALPVVKDQHIIVPGYDLAVEKQEDGLLAVFTKQ